MTIWTDLTTLGAEGRQRVDLLNRSAQQQAAWAARQLATQIDQWGWTIGETAHDATHTPVPTPAGGVEALHDPDEPAPTAARQDDQDPATRPGARVEALERLRIMMRKPTQQERLDWQHAPYPGHSDTALDRRRQLLAAAVEAADQLPQARAALDEQRQEIGRRRVDLAQAQAAEQAAAELVTRWQTAIDDTYQAALRQAHQDQAAAVAAQVRIEQGRDWLGRGGAQIRQARQLRQDLAATYPRIGAPVRYELGWPYTAASEIAAGDWAARGQDPDQGLAAAQAAHHAAETARKQAELHAQQPERGVWSALQAIDRTNRAGQQARTELPKLDAEQQRRAQRSPEQQVVEQKLIDEHRSADAAAKRRQRDQALHANPLHHSPRYDSPHRDGPGLSI